MSQQEGDLLNDEHHFGKKFKHTLDSDEEDDEVDAEKYNIMDNNEIEGEEKATVDFDGDIKITPFNMDEELETGHFDKEGTYIFKKEENIRDNWLDNVDWSRVSKRKDGDDKDDDDNETAESATEELYKQVIELIRPGETIQRAMQRFAKDCPKVKKGQKRKVNVIDVDDSKAKAAKESITKLTAIADKILHTGDMDVYERKYEEFEMHLKRIQKEQQIHVSTVESDMFGDDFTEGAKASTSHQVPEISSVTWEFKWEDTDTAAISGPHTSEEMLSWVNEGRFKDGVYVRRTDSTDAKFYSSKRIDFDLYI